MTKKATKENPKSTKITWNLEIRKVSDLIEYDKNPRSLTEKGLTDLKKSIQKFGLAEPIVINEDNIIIGGHGRKKILQELGIEKVDCYVPNRQLSIKEVEELCIRLNKNIAGVFDFDILANQFEIGDLAEWGFDASDFNIDVAPKTKEEGEESKRATISLECDKEELGDIVDWLNIKFKESAFKNIVID